MAIIPFRAQKMNGNQGLQKKIILHDRCLAVQQSKPRFRPRGRRSSADTEEEKETIIFGYEYSIAVIFEYLMKESLFFRDHSGKKAVFRWTYL